MIVSEWIQSDIHLSAALQMQNAIDQITDYQLLDYPFV
jgi:hypothetical protein